MMSGDNHVDSGKRNIRRLIWLYFLLTIFEGAIRRWILPGLAGPLLIVRDPVAIVILVMAWKQGLLRRPLIFSLISGIGVASFCTTMLVGHRDILVALFGLRILILHLPLVLVVGRVFDISDVLKIGRATCIIAVPMVALIAAQFFFPQTHWVNIAIGGEGTAGFAGAMGYYRPPGTFSFTNGLAQFYAMVGAFVAGFAFFGKVMKKWWWIAGGVATILAVPLSISRGLLFQLAIAGALFLVAGLANPRLTPKVIAGCAALGLLISVATALPTFKGAVVAFAARWDSANEVEGGVQGVLVDRFLGGLYTALTQYEDVPILGYGLGIGTNAGAHLLSGKRAFMVGEGEWLRTIGEMGPLLGIGLIAARVLLAGFLLKHVIHSVYRGNAFPVPLSGIAALWLAQGNWAQPTSLGMAVLAGGFVLGACRVPRHVTAHLRSLDGITSKGSKLTDV